MSYSYGGELCLLYIAVVIRVVNKTCYSLTTITKRSHFTVELAYEVNEMGNLLTTCE